MFDHCLYFNTTSLARQLEREWVRAFKPFGLTPSQAFMLRVILQRAPIAYTALAEELNITKATCSRTVEGLIKLGFIERVQADDDARSFMLAARPSALDIEKDLNAASSNMTQTIKHQIGEKEFSSTVESMKRIKTTIS